MKACQRRNRRWTRWGRGGEVSAGFHRLKYAVMSTGRLMTPTRMIQPHAARACCAVVEPARNKKKGEPRSTRTRSAPPGDISHSSRHAITGSKLPPPRDAARLPPAAPPPATPTSLRLLFTFSAPGTGCSDASSLFSPFFQVGRSVIDIPAVGSPRFCLSILFEGSRGVCYSGILGDGRRFACTYVE